MIRFLLYLCFINALASLSAFYDKRAAINNAWRISEQFLLMLSLLGGSFAMYITLRSIRHKTRKLTFMVGIPFIIFLQVFFLVWLAISPHLYATL